MLDLMLGVPVPLSDFPRYQLTFGPSPVHPMERLSAHLGGAKIWAKREDCNAGLANGGNKVRKLEYLVHDALALIDLVRNGEIGKDSTVLYAHLGGQPALSVYGALFS